MYKRQIKRGDIYYVDLNPTIGSEQGGIRPCLIVQNDVGNKHSPTIVIAPITGKLRKNPLPTHVLIPQSCGLDMDSLVLMEQIRTFDRARLGAYIGRVEDTLLPTVDKALAICVGIEQNGGRLWN